jgi:BioD-like phosphotransacetylase family protein
LQGRGFEDDDKKEGDEMRSVVITSTRTAAGKTTVGLGIGLNTAVKVGYFKPFGDHLVYTKKNLVDLDTTVFCEWLGIDRGSEECCLGFDPEKIMYRWNPDEIRGALKNEFDKVSAGSELMLVETGRNFSYGGIMGIDSVSLAQALGSDMLLVAEGGVDLIVDKVIAVSRCIENNAKLLGVVINKCEEAELQKIEELVKPHFERTGIRLLGILPRIPALERMSVELVKDKLKAKLVAGSEGLDNKVCKVLVGALSADRAMKMPAFHEENKLIITGGDRVDLIFASLNEDTSGIVLTNNILPHPKVMAKADELGIPILSVPMNTYDTSSIVDHIVAEIKPEESGKKELIKEMVGKGLDTDAIFRG